jgi:hypothetical protein
MSIMEIRFGSLVNVYGKPAPYTGFTFMPAEVELSGNGFTLEFKLQDTADPPMELRMAIAGRFDAAWVRARLPRVFGFTPPAPETEKALLDVGFVAAQPDGSYAIPFRCTDHYGRTGLMFSPEGPDEASQTAIASAFWSLLLQSPDDLEDFEAKVYHPGAGVWLRYECSHGEVFCDELVE